MALDIKQLSTAWETDLPKYTSLGKIVTAFIQKEITSFELLPEVSCRTKDLLSIVKKIKKKLREGPYGYEDLTDRLGIRIICPFLEDLKTVDDFLNKYFLIKKFEYKRDDLDYNTLDYLSNHYDVCINPNIKQFAKSNDFDGLVFEIQVRTLNQHAWANAAHLLSYKQEVGIPKTTRRRIYRLLSLYELADDEFSAINKNLIEHPDNSVYYILRKLESKIYKYAKVDFDRDISVYTLKIILNYFSKDEKKIIFSEIDSFISKNEEKIQRIFDDNRIRFYEFSFLTQPEIFLIWYGLEEYLFSIEDNWSNDFDPFELEQIATLWGKTL
jgi:putative GTP pyrophosphokinase